jgi:glycosidase
VEADPDPARTDQSVTVTFYADRGNEGLKDCACDVYAHTGLITDQSSEWRYVMDDWPVNRDLTKLTQVGPNTYELVIDDVRDFYSRNRTGFGDVPPPDVETIQQLAFVFRNADGTREGKAPDGGDVFVEVNDVGGPDPFVAVRITEPSANPPLYPFITSQDQTVTVRAAADVANVDRFSELRLFVDGTQVATSSTQTLTYDLALDTPNRYGLRVEAEAVSGSETVASTAETYLIRTPDVTTQDRPAGVDDGISYSDDGTSATLSLYAPNKDFVYVIGDVTDWEVRSSAFMKRDDEADGAHWWITVDGLTPGEEYDFQYFVDGELRVPDPFSRKVRSPNDQFLNQDYVVYPNLKRYPGEQTENLVSVLQPGQEPFAFTPFDPPPQDELVIYELLLRDFLEQHSYQALTDTLDYLDRLGVNAVELLPVANFDGNVSWGYNPNAHFALDKSYGPPEDLKQFVEEAHRRGIAVILDVVYNHVTGLSPLVQLYGDTSGNPFLEVPGDCGPFEELNQSSPFIQRYLDRANEYWLTEFNVDGFRFDLAKCVGGEAGAKRMADYVWDNVDPEAYMILEYFGGFEEEQRLANYRADTNGGLMMWQNLNRPYSQAAMGYVGTGQSFSSDFRATYFGFRTDGQGNGFNRPNLIPYMESHDEQWLMHRNRTFGREAGDGSYSVRELQTALNRQKLAGAFFFLVPGPRMAWQFGELGYGYATDECLKPSEGDGECPADLYGRTAPKPVRWEYRDPAESPDRVRLYRTWQELLRLRRSSPAFTDIPSINDPEEGINIQAADGDVIRWIVIENGSMDAVIVGNFGVTRREATVTFPQTGTWYNFFEDVSRGVSSPTQTLSLLPGEFRVYTSESVAAPPPGLVLGAPVARSSAQVGTDGVVDFGDTGVEIDFRGVSGSGSVIVEKLGEGPIGTDGIPAEANVSTYRYVVTTTGDLQVGAATEIRLDVATLSGIGDGGEGSVSIYRRSTEGEGTFSELTTSVSAGRLVAETGTFSEFVLGSPTEPLPVDMAGFDAVVRGGEGGEGPAVELSWRTAAEAGNAGFHVQRRQDGAWAKIGFVEGRGTTSDPQRYRFVDEAVPAGADSLAYRLQQVDVDGDVHLSGTVVVGLRLPEALTLAAPYPNPSRSRVTIRYAVPSRQSVELAVYDVLGRRVQTLVRSPQQGRQQRVLDVSALASGTYVLRLQAGTTVRTQRLTVVR